MLKKFEQLFGKKSSFMLMAIFIVISYLVSFFIPLIGQTREITGVYVISVGISIVGTALLSLTSLFRGDRKYRFDNTIMLALWLLSNMLCLVLSIIAVLANHLLPPGSFS